MAYFQLQPAEMELQELADSYWKEAGERERSLEAAAYEAGEAIRKGEHTLSNLEAIVRWKSERMVHYLIGNSDESIRAALAVAAEPSAKAEDAVNALVSLRGVDIAIASAVMSAIYPERYAVLDFRALEALGHARHDVGFYTEYKRAKASGGLRDCEGARRSAGAHGSARAGARAVAMVADPCRRADAAVAPCCAMPQSGEIKIESVSNSFEIGPVQVGAGQLFLIAGPCVIESEAHVRTMAEAIQRITADLGIPLHLQSQLRQGQPHQREELSRAGTGRGHAHPGPAGEGYGPAGADRRARAGPLRSGRRGRGRAADSRLSLPPDRSAGGRGQDGPRRQHQEGPVCGAVGHDAPGRKGALDGQ